MAIEVLASGPTLVEFQPAGGTFSSFGRTSDDALPEIETTVHSHIVRSTEFGAEPDEIIHLGSTAVLTFELVKWDVDIAEDMMQAIPNEGTPATELDAGTVGRLWSAGEDGHYFKIRISPSVTGQIIYTFHRCWLDGQALRVFNMGNREKRLAAVIQVLRDDNDRLYQTTTVA